MKQWYCHLNLKPQGPFSEEEIRRKIHHGEIGPQDLICDESGLWRAASEWGVFPLQLFPAAQSYSAAVQVDEALREWVLLGVSGLQSGGLQEGPFSVLELKKLLQAGELSPYRYVWKSGLSGWCQLKDRPEFIDVITSESLSNPSLV